MNGPFSNVGATDQPIVAPCVFAGDGHRDVWFRFDAASTFALQVDCCGLTSLDSILTAFDACGGTLIGCSNDSSCGAQSNMQITVAAG
ncbi:MAG TPA: hypothetical protein VKF62_11135, partial [Planctomycetota bacterium]|nr:hypothetical protein [Planctomycetota bacterium]